jgi:hypothetical protein
MAPDELMVDVSGRLGNYRMVFQWQEDFNAMQFTCHFDLVVPGINRGMAALAVLNANAELWLGHFDLPDDTSVPCLRHTSLFRGQTHGSNADHVQDLMDIALAECERFYPMFQLLTNDYDVMDERQLTFATLDIAGEA